MPKQIISLFLVICMMLCLVACNSTEPNSNTNDTTTETQTTTSQNNEETSQTEFENNNVLSTEAHSYVEQDKNSQSVQTQPPVNQYSPTNNSKPSTHTHRYSSATCTSPKKCSCGATAGSALGHQYSSATCTSPKICNRCGVTSGSELGHSYSAANCTSPKTCNRCGQTSGSALGHKYVNNKCSRCGKVDPDTLPVGLHEIPLIDSSYYNAYFHYSYNKDFTDAFGNKYDGVHFYNGLWEKKYSIHNLDNKYSTFNGAIVATPNTLSSSKYCIEIYVDDILRFSKNNFTKTTGAVPFSVNVKNGLQLKIVVYDGGGSSDVTGMEIGIVNAQLKK